MKNYIFTNDEMMKMHAEHAYGDIAFINENVVDLRPDEESEREYGQLSALEGLEKINHILIEYGLYSLAGQLKSAIKASTVTYGYGYLGAIPYLPYDVYKSFANTLFNELDRLQLA